MAQEQDIGTLSHVGLTPLQAKIYLTLFQNGRQTVKLLSERANVDRANAYRELLKLYKIGLVKKVISAPNLYEALPIEVAISLLLSYKEDEYKKTKKEAEALLRKCRCHSTASFEKLDQFFNHVPKRNAFMGSAKSNRESAQITNDTISNLKRFSQALEVNMETHKNALKHGVRTRIIVEKPKERKALHRAIRNLMACPNFEIRYTIIPPQVLGACFDGKTIAVLTDPWPIYRNRHA